VTVWHYTIGKRFAQIMADGAIKPATAHVPKDERPIVWFSLNERWEPTARKMTVNPDGTLVPLDMMGTEEHGGGLVRIGVAPETAPYDWKTLRKTSGMSSRMASSLSRAATEMGARPRDWRGTFEPVPRSSWTAIERFQNGVWVPLPFSTTQELLRQPSALGYCTECGKERLPEARFCVYCGARLNEDLGGGRVLAVRRE
jgi:hypothetical protein